MNAARTSAWLLASALLACAPAAKAQEPEAGPRHRPLVWAGVTVTAAGVADIIGGTLAVVLWKPDAGCRGHTSTDPSVPSHFTTCEATGGGALPGAFMLAGGSLPAAIGIPLWLVGAADARARDGERAAPLPERVVLGAGSGAPRWSF